MINLIFLRIFYHPSPPFITKLKIDITTYKGSRVKPEIVFLFSIYNFSFSTNCYYFSTLLTLINQDFWIKLIIITIFYLYICIATRKRKKKSFMK